MTSADIYGLVRKITPLDALEESHIQDTLGWIQSGAPLYRIKKPDVPNKHLVSYCTVFDEKFSKILLVDHKKACLWLPSGGHVEVGEDPQETAKRECQEELNYDADFWRTDPFFLTSTLTVGHTAGHTDVSLWYVLKGDHRQTYTFDRDEFHGIRWFDLNHIKTLKSDPHMGRFIQKLTLELGKTG